MDLFVLGAVAVLSAMGGFWVGRSIKWQLAQADGGTSIPAEATAERAERGIMVKALSQYREVGSPVAGELKVAEENGVKKIHIRPLQGKVYAPASGKITHLFPMGSAMLLKADFGADIFLRAGSRVDEMCSQWYRCRVMENEIVRKGSLLLEYDVEHIEESGADGEVILSIENEEVLGPLTRSTSNQVKVGEPILYVPCDIRSVSYERQP